MNGLRLGLLAGLAIVIVAVVITYRTVPDRTTDATHFDTLIVLGSPCEPDGAPSPEQRERVLEGVREMKAGRSDHMIVTGGAAHNRFVEAESMARLAEAQGVPADDVSIEPQARNTIENVFYSYSIMQAHDWKTAEGGEFSKPSSACRSDPVALSIRMADTCRAMATGVYVVAEGDYLRLRSRRDNGAALVWLSQIQVPAGEPLGRAC